MQFDLKQGTTWMIAIVCSGLGGAFLNQWYANRSTVVEYSINKTVLGTDQTTLPNFRVQIGDTALQSVFIYAVKLQYRSGPELENVRVGIRLLTPSVKLVGNTVVEKPGEAFDFNCAAFETRTKSSGTTCALRRLNSNVGAYTVSFATNEDAKIEVSIDAKNTQVRQAEIPSAKEPQWLLSMEVVAFVAGCVALVFSIRQLRSSL